MTTEPLPFLLILAGSASRSDPALLPAVCWMAGIMFLAMAVDATGRKAALLALTGLVLMPLAWLTASHPAAGLLATIVSGAWALTLLTTKRGPTAAD